MVTDSSFIIIIVFIRLNSYQDKRTYTYCGVTHQLLPIGLLSKPEHLTWVDNIRELKVVQFSQHPPIRIDAIGKVEQWFAV